MNAKPYTPEQMQRLTDLGNANAILHKLMVGGELKSERGWWMLQRAFSHILRLGTMVQAADGQLRKQKQ